MEVTGPCPLCRKVVELQVAGAGRPVRCPECGGEILIQLGDLFFEKHTIDRCLLCAEQHLYRQKDFNQRLGCLIVITGSGIGLVLAGLYSAVWLWGVLLLTAALDAVLNRMVPDVVICYRCKAHYRQMADNPGIGPFDLELADAIEGRMGGGFVPPQTGS
ncbi:MAG: hypothetical protein ACE5HD_00535 [Acidobacteriota bacterium]